MSFTTAAGFGIDRSIARSVGSTHRSGGGHDGMSVSNLDEVLRMETFLFGVGRLNAYVFYEVRPEGFVDLERRHEIWLLYVPPIDEYGYGSKIVRTIKIFLSFLRTRRSIAIDVATTTI